jgi:hypothetical protein
LAERRGRPVYGKAKDDQYRLRIDSEERAMLEFLAEKDGISKSEAIRRSLRMYYNLKKYSD